MADRFVTNIPGGARDGPRDSTFTFTWEQVASYYKLFGDYSLKYFDRKISSKPEIHALLKRSELGPVGDREVDFFYRAVGMIPGEPVSFPIFMRGLGEFGKKGRLAAKPSGLRKFGAREIYALHKLFNATDADRNELLTMQELHTALSAVDRTVTQRDVAALVKRLDLNRNGLISFDEFVHGLAIAAINMDNLGEKLTMAKDKAQQQQQAAADEFKTAVPNGKPQANGRSKAQPPLPPPANGRVPVQAQQPPPPPEPPVGALPPAAARGRGPPPPQQVHSVGIVKPAGARGGALDPELQRTDMLKAEAMKVFMMADTDNSGTIDEQELFSLLKQLLGNVTLPESNRIYHEMDSNRSGTITVDEFIQVFLKYKWDTSKMRTTLQQSRSAGPSMDWEIPYEELEIGKRLGEGAFGVVFKGMWRGIPVAVKELKPLANSKTVIDDFRKEISILGRLRHPNITLYMGACTKAPHLCMVSEYLDKGSLFDLLHVRKERLDLRQTLSFAKQTAFGLNYLHLSNIIHRDCKSLNLLIDKHNVLKLCDFGLATVKESSSMKEQVGSPHWMAPELLLGKKYDEKVDVWAWGICLWEMVCGKVPFADLKPVQLLQIVGHDGKRPTIPKEIPVDLQRLLKICWDTEASKRPNFGQIIAHLDRISSQT